MLTVLRSIKGSWQNLRRSTNSEKGCYNRVLPYLKWTALHLCCKAHVGMYIRTCTIQHCSTAAIAVTHAQLACFDDNSVDPQPILSCLCMHALHIPLSASSEPCAPYLQLPLIPPALALLHPPPEDLKAFLGAQRLSVMSMVVLLLA